MDDLVSVIVPVYNVEKYVGKMLDSLLAQNYKNLEIICVDDGSTDASLNILKKYMYRDSRIKIIEKTNSGVSDARNIGIENAKGKYIYFCDADDILHITLISTLVALIKNADLAYVDFVRNEGEFKQLDGEINQDRDDFCEVILNDNGYLWNKIFVTEIIKIHTLRFDRNIAICEDEVFIFNYLQYINKIKYNPSCLYFYRLHSDSATGNRKITSKQLTFCEARYKILNFIEQGNYREDCLNQALNQTLITFSYTTKDLLFKQKNRELREKWLGYIIDHFCIIKKKYNISFNKEWNIKLRLYYVIMSELAFWKRKG